MPAYGYFGHHKCASTWVQYLVHGLCEKLRMSHLVLPTRRSYEEDLPGYLTRHPVHFACVTNAEWDQIEPILAGRRSFHVIRDPRDIVTSAYFSHLKSHIDKGWPELASIRRELQACGKTEGLIRTIDNLMVLPVAGTRIALFEAMRDWHYTHPDILELRYEDLVADPYGGFLRILRFLDLVDEAPFGLRAQLSWAAWHTRRAVLRQHRPLDAAPRRIPSPLALQIIQDNSFERISGGRRKGEENVDSHFRKGVAGDWRNHFDAEVEAHFRRRTGDLLARLGYAD